MGAPSGAVDGPSPRDDTPAARARALRAGPGLVAAREYAAGGEVELLRSHPTSVTAFENWERTRFGDAEHGPRPSAGRSGGLPDA